MEITLKKKTGSSDKDPLIVMLDPDESIPSEKRVKGILKIAIGETIDLPDDIAYQVMAKHKGLFEIKTPAVEPEAKYKTKIMKPEL